MNRIPSAGNGDAAFNSDPVQRLWTRGCLRGGVCAGDASAVPQPGQERTLMTG